jgi:hypothetical protein
MTYSLKNAKKQRLSKPEQVLEFVQKICAVSKTVDFSPLSSPSVRFLLKESNQRATESLISKVVLEHLVLVDDPMTLARLDLNDAANFQKNSYVLSETLELPLFAMERKLFEGKTEVTCKFQTQRTNINEHIVASLLTIYLNEQQKFQKAFVKPIVMENTIAGGGVMGFTVPLAGEPITKGPKKRKKKAGSDKQTESDKKAPEETKAGK